MNWLKSAIVLYAVCFLIVLPVFDFKKFNGNALGETMSRFVPPIYYHKDTVEKEDHFDERKMYLCIEYHRRVAQYFPYQKAEALAMKGFCSERLDHLNDAVDAYSSSIKENPDYFFPYYNLGVIYYRKADYKNAVNYFSQALQKDVRKNMILMMRSKVYMDVRNSDMQNLDLSLSMVLGRQSAYVLLLESLHRLNSYQPLFEAALGGLQERIGIEDLFYYYLGLSAHALGKEDVAGAMMIKANQAHAQQGSSLESFLKPRVRFF